MPYGERWVIYYPAFLHREVFEFQAPWPFNKGVWCDNPDDLRSSNEISLSHLLCRDLIPPRGWQGFSFVNEIAISFHSNDSLLTACLDQVKEFPTLQERARCWLIIRTTTGFSRFVRILASLGFNVSLRFESGSISDDELFRELEDICNYALHEPSLKTQIQPVMSRLLISSSQSFLGPVGTMGGRQGLFLDRNDKWQGESFLDDQLYQEEGDTYLDILALSEQRKKENYEGPCGSCPEYPLCRGHLRFDRNDKINMCEAWKRIGRKLDHERLLFEGHSLTEEESLIISTADARWLNIAKIR